MDRNTAFLGAQQIRTYAQPIIASTVEHIDHHLQIKGLCLLQH